MRNVRENSLNLIKEKIKTCNVRLLMIDPYMATNHHEIEDIFESSYRQNLWRDARDSLRKFCELKESLDESLKRNLEIKVFRIFTAFNLVVSDIDTDDSIMTVEILCHKGEGEAVFQRPRLILTPNTNRGLYSFFLKSAEQIWSISKEVDSCGMEKHE